MKNLNKKNTHILQYRAEWINYANGALFYLKILIYNSVRMDVFSIKLFMEVKDM